jgi:hypothetical protein
MAVVSDPLLSAEHISAEVEGGGNREEGGEVDGTVPLRFGEDQGSAFRSRAEGGRVEGAE